MNGISPFWGVVLMAIIGGIFYLLCSLFSWSFDWKEWNLFSDIVASLGLLIVGRMLLEVIRQIFTGDRFDV